MTQQQVAGFNSAEDDFFLWCPLWQNLYLSRVSLRLMASTCPSLSFVINNFVGKIRQMTAESSRDCQARTLKCIPKHTQTPDVYFLLVLSSPSLRQPPVSSFGFWFFSV